MIKINPHKDKLMPILGDMSVPWLSHYGTCHIFFGKQRNTAYVRSSTTAQSPSLAEVLTTPLSLVLIKLKSFPMYSYYVSITVCCFVFNWMLFLFCFVLVFFNKKKRRKKSNTPWNSSPKEKTYSQHLWRITEEWTPLRPAVALTAFSRPVA